MSHDARLMCSLTLILVSTIVFGVLTVESSYARSAKVEELVQVKAQPVPDGDEMLPFRGDAAERLVNDCAKVEQIDPHAGKPKYDELLSVFKCTRYINGVIDGFEVGARHLLAKGDKSPPLAKSDKPLVFACIPDNTSDARLAEVIVDFGKANRASLKNIPALPFVLKALMHEFPCR